MNEGDICCTCAKENSGTIKISDLDYDGRTFSEKIIACVHPTLEIDPDNIPKICRTCIASLNLAYRFKTTALNSLKSLNYVDGKLIDYDDEDLRTIEIEEDSSNDHLSFQNDDLDNDELENAVHLITELTDGEPDNREKYNCEKCSLNFQEKTEYENHLSKIHMENLACKICDKSFKTWHRLKNHASCHISKKNYNCTNCSKAFVRMSSLKRHMTTHYAPPGQKSKRTPFLCTICGKSFPFSNGAARHMRIHFGIKTHECQICHKQFNQSTHLHVHMRTHSGEKPYICEICGDSFTLRAGLSKHTKTKHKQDEKKKIAIHDVFYS